MAIECTYFLVGVLIMITYASVFFYLYVNKPANPEPPLLGGALPVIGNAHTFLKEKNSKDLWKLLMFTANDCLEKGGVIKVNTVWPSFTHYIIADPDDFLVVANNAHKHYFYDSFRIQLGNALFTHKSQDDEWKHHRKQINLALTPRCLENVMPMVNGCGRSLCEAWAAECGRPFEHIQSLHEAVMSAVVGDLDRSLARDYIATTTFVEETISMKMCNFLMHFNFIFSRTEVGRKFQEAAEHINTLGWKIIQNKRELLKDTKYEPRSVVDYVVRNVDFNDQELLSEINSVVTAGYTTTASSLTSLFMLLGAYPRVQEKLYQELKSVYDSSNRDVVKSDFAKLPYLDAVIKEAIRLYPAGPIALRFSDKPMVLKNYTLPANRHYALNIYGTNRHPSWGADRHEFKPERWLAPETLPPHHAFTTFNLGRRDCIGRNYSMISMKIFTAHLVRRFKIHADISKYELKIEVVIRPASGGVIRVEERNPDSKSNEDTPGENL